LTFMNGHAAFVRVLTQQTIVTSLTNNAGANGPNIQPTLISTGTVLQITGTVSADRRYVTLSMQPSLVGPLVINLITVSTTSLGGLGGLGGNNNNNNNAIVSTSTVLQEPILPVTQIKTVVTVPDRGTILLGGQKLAGTTEVEVGVPILSKIPIINRLFTNKTTVKDESTLLILVKPTIIIQGEQEDELYPGLLPNPSTYQGGSRYVPMGP
jgi:type II secretory pathway component GspD/PulD (secretin)